MKRNSSCSTAWTSVGAAKNYTSNHLLITVRTYKTSDRQHAGKSVGEMTSLSSQAGQNGGIYRGQKEDVLSPYARICQLGGKGTAQNHYLGFLTCEEMSFRKPFSGVQFSSKKRFDAQKMK